MNRPERTRNNTQASFVSSTGPSRGSSYSSRSSDQHKSVPWHLPMQGASTAAAQQPDRFGNHAIMLERLRVGTSATISGFVIIREGEHRFHLQHAGEAMIGSVRTVVDWIQQLKRDM